MDILGLLFYVVIGIGIIWFYYDLVVRYIKLKSRVEILENILVGLVQILPGTEDIDK